MNSSDVTHAVGGKPANEWGLHDTAGNVAEWVWDLYDSYYPRGTIENPVEDPVGAEQGSDRVTRGGNWRSFAYYCRAAARSRWTADARSRVVGFRPARSVPVP